jgi:hypothetical protein
VRSRSSCIALNDTEPDTAPFSVVALGTMTTSRYNAWLRVSATALSGYANFKPWGDGGHRSCISLVATRQYRQAPSPPVPRALGPGAGPWFDPTETRWRGVWGAEPPAWKLVSDSERGPSSSRRFAGARGAGRRSSLPGGCGGTASPRCVLQVVLAR